MDTTPWTPWDRWRYEELKQSKKDGYKDKKKEKWDASDKLELALLTSKSLQLTTLSPQDNTEWEASYVCLRDLLPDVDFDSDDPPKKRQNMFYYRILRKSKMLFQQPPWTPWEDAAYRFLGKLHVLRTPLQKTIFTKLTNRREALSKAKESYYLLRLAEPKDKFDPKQSGWERYYTLLVLFAPELTEVGPEKIQEVASAGCPKSMSYFDSELGSLVPSLPEEPENAFNRDSEDEFHYE
eukprot:GHVQ01030412.1.p1 GENE.GHVQ01030412.1~~GHVQ01030412.1.p1  ORF type:complete len:279 (+),score=22.21 GHVQ01030412.1:124-837(+)